MADAGPEELAKLKAELKELRAKREALVNKPAPLDASGQPEPWHISAVANAAIELDDEINALERRIDPTRNNLDAFETLARDAEPVTATGTGDITDPDRGNVHAARDDAELAGQLFSGANKPAAPTAAHAAPPAAGASGIDAEIAAATRDSPHGSEKLERLEETKALSGCSPKMAVTILVVLVVAIGIGVAVSKGGGGKSTTSPGASSGASAGAQPGAPSGGADFTSFAGHYVMSTGLDQPFAGDAAFIVDKNAYPSVTPGPGSASFDVDANGKITAGEYHANYRAVKPSIECTFTFDSTKVTGSIAMTGPGAIGQITWDGVLKISGTNCATGYPTQIPRQIGIVGPDALMCGTNLEPSLTACKVIGAQASVAKFARK
jgi:hypothetical protein